ncbi:MAG: CBS domain-containing protein [Haliscomenobacter sp.]|nr:CBS domain-containing protein [Haliscomenobacter sp.]MBK7475116.1 CBS domain-containing protein [Haliscomenobacter sp.]MBK8879924.1 CBS domain-containing protein [Haliscomenobacter sp.]
MKQVKEVMSKHLITASPGSTVSDLRMLMTRYNIGAIPIVLEGDTPQTVGIVTDLDLRNIKDAALPASSIMTTVLHSVSPNASVAAAANVMLQYGIHHLLVKDRQDLVGMVSALDLLTVVADTRSSVANRMIFM